MIDILFNFFNDCKKTCGPGAEVIKLEVTPALFYEISRQCAAMTKYMVPDTYTLGETTVKFMDVETCVKNKEYSND